MNSDVVHNRSEAIALTSRALSRYSAGTEHALQLFDGALVSAHSMADRELAARRVELEKAKAALGAADSCSVAECQRRVTWAEQRVMAADSVVKTIFMAGDQFREKAQRFSALANDATLRGQAKLRTLDRDLDRYLTASRDGVSNTVSNSLGNARTRITFGSVLACLGLEEIDVAAADFSDNPVISWQHATRSEVEWAVDRWDAVVSKVAARGGCRNELAERDARDGATGTMRQLASVWDMFLGDNAITLETSPSGGFKVIDGRHRLLVAAEMGIEHLPARVIRKDLK